ncbi:hypothetical protein Ksed_12190 [Kytococcus sedentarius DSM 20547]|uniref:Uncharacterized protein n=1 Tax=Kytococcus sedentarius (strain ATCC 14392 / DSM 20547 / JCM 11482 / CCUG 33030 / NBRC 15357 / NCTC 11040 / CCM 314 / 541) TaxID=478801 RepID=C7NH97_KYTSD|nr:hypothetical protein Ksed_12190 [Kytococcus sedentarius DSM 20547]
MGTAVMANATSAAPESLVALLGVTVSSIEMV